MFEVRIIAAVLAAVLRRNTSFLHMLACLLPRCVLLSPWLQVCCQEGRQATCLPNHALGVLWVDLAG